MSSKPVSFLAKTALLNSDGVLSLSNLLLLVLIAKLAIFPVLDWGTVVALFLSLANYNGKKWLARMADTKTTEEAGRLKAVEAEIKAITSAMTLKGLGYLK